MTDSLLEALRLVTQFDARLLDIVGLSLRVSLAAVVLGAVIGLPIGAWLAVSRFRGRTILLVLLNGLMGLPSVVVGVVVYLALSRSGPFGEMGLLFSPGAMVIAQSLLVIPLVGALTRQTVEDAWTDYAAEFRVMRFTRWQSILTLLHDCRHSLLVTLLAGIGRAMSEVGAVMIVGGNIDQVTRVMTTAIALETSKGDLPLAIALGMVLLAVVLTLNGIAFGVRRWAMKRFA
jgi:tungstate transport system permease protein